MDWGCIIGIIFFVINLLVENIGRVFADLICVVWWVAIWNFVEILLLDNREIKWKRLNYQQLYDAEVTFVFE